MFTGIIEAIGHVASIENIGGDRRMVIKAQHACLHGVELGDSIAVNGVCLTASQLTNRGFVADVSAETLAATTARSWQPGMRINLERALTPNKPLGGHLVSGHVDGIGTLLTDQEDARSRRLMFEAPQELARYIARKGSITIDGVSLTVNEVRKNQFGVNIVPHTLRHTTLGELKAGGAVNLEVDLIARYLERLLSVKEES